MKTSGLRSVIVDIDAILCEFGLHSEPGLHRLADFLDRNHSDTVGGLAKKLSKIDPKHVVTGPSIEPALERWTSFQQPFVRIMAPKEAKDLAAFIDAIRRHARSDLNVLSSTLKMSGSQRKKVSTPPNPTRQDVVQRLARRLEDALGDERGFSSVYRELAENSALPVAEVIAIAKQFAQKSSRSRPAALKLIWARHQNLMNARAKSDATGGRLAG